MWPLHQATLSQVGGGLRMWCYIYSLMQNFIHMVWIHFLHDGHFCHTRIQMYFNLCLRVIIYYYFLIKISKKQINCFLYFNVNIKNTCIVKYIHDLIYIIINHDIIINKKGCIKKWKIKSCIVFCHDILIFHRLKHFKKTVALLL